MNDRRIDHASMTGQPLHMTAENKPAKDDEGQRRTIRRTAIILGLLAFAWYFGFMALRLL
jgi:hypothetical protein